MGHAELRRGTDVLREDRLNYTPLPGSVQLVRRRAARLVAEWGHPGIAGDFALVVGELACNAVLHGCVPRRHFRVHLKLTRLVVRAEVTDPRGERLPRRRQAADDEMFGRGMVIVDALASRWGVTPLEVGKTVWVELDLT
ncbi:ATP-binding protein [Streptomyces sp. P38-E01]|uniref:ATP-binding protein n=1 Tax=Streptomyces tardus TaxID=2780544 RepID=A0A949N4C9_9ACTN|nr:ATP-binding protein [Streptomyces tardus]MBU7596827.1 ATP-binding protein [Streptomyces tardus]